MKSFPGPRTPANLSESLQQRLNTYAVAAGAAGVGALALAQPAGAKIVYTPVHEIIPYPSTIGLDLNGDGVNDFVFSNFYHYYEHSFIVSLAIYPPVMGNGIMVSPSMERRSCAWSQVVPLRPGERIGNQKKFDTRNNVNAGMAQYWKSAYPYRSTRNGYACQWANNGHGIKKRYLGLKFLIDGKVHFGWARMNVQFTRLAGRKHHPTITGILTGYAYETIPNRSIITGKTKGPGVVTMQPTTLGHLAAGQR